jgi:hypothetical protein
MAVFLWTARIFSPLPPFSVVGPARQRWLTALPLSPVSSAAADRPGPLVGTTSNLPLDSDARSWGETAAAPRSLLPSWERLPAPGPFKWKPHPTPLPLLPSLLQFRSRASQPKSRSKRRRSVVRLLRIAIDTEPPSSSFCRSVSFAPLSSFSPSISRVGWWPIEPFYASSGELLRGQPWQVPLGSFSGCAKDLSVIASFPSNFPCLYLLHLWPLGP